MLTVPEQNADEAIAAIRSTRPSVSVMATGASIEIYKEVGYPTDVAKRFDLAKMQGTHAIGHTRMATEVRGDDARLTSVLDRPRSVPRA